MVRYTQEFKNKVIAYRFAGHTYTQCIVKFNISSRTLANWLKLNEDKIVQGKVKQPSKVKHITPIKHYTTKDLDIKYNSRFLSWLASIFQINKYWNLSKNDLKNKIIHEINLI